MSNVVKLNPGGVPPQLLASIEESARARIESDGDMANIVTSADTLLQLVSAAHEAARLRAEIEAHRDIVSLCGSMSPEKVRERLLELKAEHDRMRTELEQARAELAEIKAQGADNLKPELLSDR